jgi:hypothetical protein
MLTWYIFKQHPVQTARSDSSMNGREVHLGKGSSAPGGGRFIAREAEPVPAQKYRATGSNVAQR